MCYSYRWCGVTAIDSVTCGDCVTREVCYCVRPRESVFCVMVTVRKGLCHTYINRASLLCVMVAVRKGLCLTYTGFLCHMS